MKNLQKQKEEILIKLGEIDTQLEEGENIEAIKIQRWFFFKNKLRVSMDKSTGLLWANLNYFPYKSQNGYNLNGYNFTEAQNTVKEYYFDGIKGFRLPMSTEIEKIMGETFPFREIRPNLKEWHFDNKNRIDCIYWQEIQLIIPSSSRDNYRGFILPCSSILVDNTDYAKNVATDNKTYNENERLKFILNLFKQNNLVPIFDNYKITKLYIERLNLVEQLNEIEKQIQENH